MLILRPIAHTLSDLLNNKVKIAEDEIASLICSLRILQDDVNHQTEQWSINKNSRSGKKKDGARSTKTSAHDEFESNNPFGMTKFNSLVIEDPLINDDPVNELNKKETSQNANRKSNQKKLKKSKESKELKIQNQMLLTDLQLIMVDQLRRTIIRLLLRTPC